MRSQPLPPLPPLLLLSLVLALALASRAAAIGLSCEEHPAHFAGLKPVLVRSWALSGTKEAVFTSNYHPRYAAHVYAPIEDLDSLKWANFDWFWAVRGQAASEGYVRLDLNRPARVYLLVGVRYNNQNPPASLPGWRPEGYAVLVKGRGEMLKYGVHQHGYRLVQGKVFIFSKMFGSVAYLPHHGWIDSKLRGAQLQGDYFAMLGEAGGGPPVVPRNPPGMNVPIVPAARCPDALHNRWVTRNTDNADIDTKGLMWKTWHPQWDPCYWCAYDHEHGSSPYHLMGYAPKYGYTARKNYREIESNEGFKNFVFRSGDYYVYYGIHAQTSKLRRVYENIHTINLAITKASTKELMVELTHKGNFAALATRARNGGFFPLSKEDSDEMDRQHFSNDFVMRRSINVINTANRDNRFMYRTPAYARMLGLYEDWTTAPICVDSLRYRGLFSVDITQPATGIKSLSQKDVAVKLGSYRGNKFYYSTGAPRILKLGYFEVSHDACKIKMGDDFPTVARNGVFYTDATGTTLFDAPGKYRIRQYVKPGFRIVLNGRYETLDSWRGMYSINTIGHMTNFGFGLDPEKN